MVVLEQREEYSLNPCLPDSTSTRGMKQFFFRLKDDYSGFNETDFSTGTAKLPAQRTVAEEVVLMVFIGFCPAHACLIQKNCGVRRFQRTA